MHLICMRFFILFGFLFFIVSCGTGPYMGKNIYGADEFVLDSYRIREGKYSILEMEGKESAELDEEYLKEYIDRIHDDDALLIVLYHPSRSDLIASIDSISHKVGFRVSEGQIHLPELDPIYVKGLTLDEARDKIQEEYSKQISDISVFVSYKRRIIGKVELAGLVSMSSIPIDGKIRLFDVLAQARIPTEANLFKSYLIRNNEMLPVDMSKLLKEGDMSQNIVMRGGDKIYIAEPSAATMMVMGEVGTQGVIPLPQGSMGLRNVLARAGGIPYTGDRSYIQIIRGSIANPKIYTLSWEHVIHLPNESLLVMPGDIVYVASKPITEWNRFISQLLPSFSGMEVINNSCRNLGIIAP